MTDLVSLNVRSESPDTVVVTAIGEIDLSNCDKLDQALNNLDGASRVVVDMSLCSFFDSSCLGVLVKHGHRLQDEGKEFRVTVDDLGRRVIELTNLSELLGLDGQLWLRAARPHRLRRQHATPGGVCSSTSLRRSTGSGPIGASNVFSCRALSDEVAQSSGVDKEAV